MQGIEMYTQGEWGSERVRERKENAGPLEWTKINSSYVTHTYMHYTSYTTHFIIKSCRIQIKIKQIAGQIYIVFPPFSTVNYVLLFLLFIADFFFC